MNSSMNEINGLSLFDVGVVVVLSYCVGILLVVLLFF